MMHVILLQSLQVINKCKAVKSLVETYVEAAEELGEITEPAREQIMNEVFEVISETSEKLLFD